MKIEDLPYYINHEIEYDDGEVRTHKFFLNLNRDIRGQWSCGYVAYAEDDHSELAIPQLVTNSSATIQEAATRMAAKIARFKNTCSNI